VLVAQLIAVLPELATWCLAGRQRAVPHRCRVGGGRPRLRLRASGQMPAAVVGLAEAVQAARSATGRHRAHRRAEYNVIGLRQDDLDGEFGPHQFKQAISETSPTDRAE
jgi:hypothetical protein